MVKTTASPASALTHSSVFPCLYPIVNVRSLEQGARHCEALLRAGAELIQIRAKKLSNGELIDLLSACLALRDRVNRGAKIIVNDYPEACAAASADGVHLGQGDSSAKIARELLGSEAIIGLSTHSLAQIRQAPQGYLNYLAFGPIFTSSTKSGHADPVGLDQLRLAAASTELPLVAIGGIDLENAQSVFSAGADTVAVVSDLEGVQDLAVRLAAYQQAELLTR